VIITKLNVLSLCTVLSYCMLLSYYLLVVLSYKPGIFNIRYCFLSGRNYLSFEKLRLFMQ